MAEQNGQISAVAEKPTVAAIAGETVQQIHAKDVKPSETPKRVKRINDVPEPPPPPKAGEPEVKTQFAELPDEGPANDKAAPEPKAEAPSADAPKEPEFSPDLINFGKQLDFSEEEIKSFGTPEKAERHLQRVLRAYQLGAQQQPPPKKEPEAKKEELAEFDPSVFDKEEYPAEARGLAKYAKETREENKQLKEQLSQVGGAVQELVQREQNREREAIRRQMDAVFNDLPEYTHVFGEGEGTRLKSDSAEMKERQRVGQQMTILQAGYAAAGIQSPSLPELQKQAIRSLHGDGKAQAKSPEEKKRDVSDRERDETGRFTTGARASNRQEPAFATNRDDDDRSTLLP